MRDWIDHPGQLTLDAAEGYSECSATYQVSVTRHRGRVDEVIRAVLTDWIFAGLHQTRATAVALIGADEVQRQEEACAHDFWDRPAIAAE